MSHKSNKVLDKIFHTAAGTLDNILVQPRRAIKNIKSGESAKGVKEIVDIVKKKGVGRVLNETFNPFSTSKYK